METQAIGLNIRLAPAPVSDSQPGKARILTEEGEVWAGLALTIPYQPVRGDLVLAVGQGAEWWVIGVIKAQGDMAFRFPADVTFNTPKGEIRFKAAKGMDLHSPNLRLRSSKLEIIARSVIEKADTAWRWIKGLMHTRAGESRTDIDATNENTAGRYTLRAKEDVKIDGDKIYLG